MTKTHEARIVESSLEKTARLLSRNHKVKVRFKPGQAMTDGRQIVLPTIPDDASQDVLDAMQGYLNHEVAHVIFTDWNAVEAAEKEDRTLSLVSNFVEDVRIEREFEEMYPGSKENFRCLVSSVFNHMREKWDEVPAFHRILATAYLHARHKNTRFYNEVLSDEERSLVDQVVNLIETSKLATSWDSNNVAREVMKLLPEPPPEEPKEGQASAGGGIADVMAGMVKGQQQPGEDPTEGDGDKPAQGQNKKHNMQSLMDLAGQLIVQQAQDEAYKHDQASKSAYIPFDTSGDIIAPTKAAYDLAGLEQMRTHGGDATAIMKLRLLNVLRSSLRSRWSGGKEHGRLDARRLARIYAGESNVYKQKMEAPRLDTAIAIAIDHSGSMNGPRLKLASEAAVVMGDVLNQIRVPFMVYGHSTESPLQYHGDHSEYARWNRLWVNVHSNFGENWPTAAHKLVDLPAMNNTLDGEALRWGAQQLMNRPEKRKVLFWFNDGFPEPGYGDQGTCQQYLKDVVAGCKKSGVEIIAFGIQSEAVQYYFPEYVVINDLGDLVREPLVKLERILKEGLKR